MIRLFINLAFLTFAVIEIRAVPPPEQKRVDLISPEVINYFKVVKETSTPDLLLSKISNPSNHREFFQHFSKSLTQSCEAIECAQLKISPVHPHCMTQANELMKNIDSLYKGNLNFESVKRNTKTARDKMMEYASKIKDLEFHMPIRATNYYAKWFEGHDNYFRQVDNDKKLIEYSKDMERKIAEVHASIQKHRSKINEKTLTQLNAEIWESFMNFMEALKDKTDLKGPLSKMIKALDALVIDENVYKLKQDVMQLKNLMDKQQLDIDQYLKTRKFPDK